MQTMIINVSIIMAIVLSHTSAQQCGPGGVRRFDSTFAKLLTLGGSGRVFPENKQNELKKYCDDSVAYINDIDKYKAKCMKNLPKQVTGVIVYSVKNTINQYCKRDSRKLTDLINSAPCANKAKQEIDGCYANMIDNFQGSMHAVEKKRVPHVCCQYYKLFQCAKDRGIKNKHCDEFKIEVVTNFIRDIFGPVVDLICGDFVEGSDKCDKLEKTPKKKRSQRRTKSFMMPLIDVLASFPEV